jgi:hypothetical protein
MMNARFVLPRLAMLVALCTMPSVTRASDGCWLDARLPAPACDCSGSLDGWSPIPAPPYHALPRLVYCGNRYGRSRGESPLAHADHPSRPPRIRAQVIINPFVSPPTAVPTPSEPQPVDAAENKGQSKIRPQIIINPFYRPEAKVACRE